MVITDLDLGIGCSRSSTGLLDIDGRHFYRIGWTGYKVVGVDKKANSVSPTETKAMKWGDQKTGKRAVLVVSREAMEGVLSCRLVGRLGGRVERRGGTRWDRRKLGVAIPTRIG